MYYIMTQKDYDTLIFLHNSIQNPHRFISQSDIDKSKNALAKIGFIQNDKFTEKGFVITEAILSPDKTVVTVNTALIQQAPVTYYYKKGFWTVISADLETGLLTVISPVFQQDIKNFVKQNLFHNLSYPPYQPFSMTLEESEWFLLEMTFLAVIQKFLKKKEPLSYEESVFSIDDLFSAESQTYIATSASTFDEHIRDYMAEFLKDDKLLKKALVGLYVKGLITATGTKENTRFLHTQTTKERFMADGLSEKVTIRIHPGDLSLSYLVTSSGLMLVTAQNKQIRVDSVPDMDWTAFECKKTEISIKKPNRFCNNCGSVLLQGSNFCTECGKKL